MQFISLHTSTARSIINIFKNVASKDETRPKLINVQVYRAKEHDHVVLAATDGRKLVTLTVFDNMLFLNLNVGLKYFIDAKTINQLKFELKIAKRGTLILISQDLLKIEQNNELVNVNQFIPNDDGYDFEIGLNAEYLLEIAEAFKEQSKTCNVKLKFKK